MGNFHLDPDQLEYEKKNLFLLFQKNNAFNSNMAFLKPETFFICIQLLYLDPVFNCCYVRKDRKECCEGNLISFDGVKNFIKTVSNEYHLRKIKKIADEIKTIDDVVALEKRYPKLFVVNDYRGNE